MCMLDSELFHLKGIHLCETIFVTGATLESSSPGSFLNGQEYKENVDSSPPCV